MPQLLDEPLLLIKAELQQITKSCVHHHLSVSMNRAACQLGITVYGYWPMVFLHVNAFSKSLQTHLVQHNAVPYQSCHPV